MDPRRHAGALAGPNRGLALTSASQLSRHTPVLLAQNDCVLATGSTILQAFDRLEVAEFSAKSLIDTLTKLGSLAPIGEDDVRDLESAFGLR